MATLDDGANPIGCSGALIYNDTPDEIIEEVCQKIYMKRKPLFLIRPRLKCDVVPEYSIEGESKWYFLVFKPFNKSYDPNYNGMDFVRKWITTKLAPVTYVITRERLSAKIHYNVLLNCAIDVNKYHDHNLMKFRMYVEYLPDLINRMRVYKYITKEYYVNMIDWERYHDYQYRLIT